MGKLPIPREALVKEVKTFWMDALVSGRDGFVFD